MMSGTKWVRVCQLEDIPVRGARVVRTESRCIALFRTADDQVFVSDNQGVGNTFNEINHLVEGAHYGVPALHEAVPPRGEDLRQRV